MTYVHNSYIDKNDEIKQSIRRRIIENVHRYMPKFKLFVYLDDKELHFTSMLTENWIPFFCYVVERNPEYATWQKLLGLATVLNTTMLNYLQTEDVWKEYPTAFWFDFTGNFITSQKDNPYETIKYLLKNSDDNLYLATTINQRMKGGIPKTNFMFNGIIIKPSVLLFSFYLLVDLIHNSQYHIKYAAVYPYHQKGGQNMIHLEFYLQRLPIPEPVYESDIDMVMNKIVKLKVFELYEMKNLNLLDQSVDLKALNLRAYEWLHKLSTRYNINP